MKILYGVQGTGNGHLTRSRIMAKQLKQAGLDVTFLVSGRAKSELFAMEHFGDFEHRDGLTFISNNGKVDNVKTLMKNNLLRFAKDVKSLDLSQFDLLINDFEPVSAWAAKQQKVMSIGIGHQYAFNHPIPMAGKTWYTHKIMQNFAPVSIPIGLHWHHFNHDILPPIVDVSIKANIKQNNKVVVYLPFENQQKVSHFLSQFKQFEFYQYAPNLSVKDVDNIHTRPISLNGFKQDLQGAKKVICNSGFELISECIHLGIDVLAKPLAGQMEQISNALALRQLNLAKTFDAFEPIIFEQFLQQSIIRPSTHYPDVAKHLVAWLQQGDWFNHTELANNLWQQPKCANAS